MPNPNWRSTDANATLVDGTYVMIASQNDPPYSEDELRLAEGLSSVFDPDFYATRYPDIVARGMVPILHYIHWGASENRDPNPWFDCEWYMRRYPEVAQIGAPPLAHYLQVGAVQAYDPHPRFDAVWYVEQHPEASQNPMLFHLRVGRHRGWATERPIIIGDYLPAPGRPPPSAAVNPVAIVIPVYRGLNQTRRCLESVLSDVDRPVGEVIVINDNSPEPEITTWLNSLANSGRITLHHNRQNMGFVASVNYGMELAQRQDVVLLNSDTEVPTGWLRRLAAHAQAFPRVATISPFSNNATICGYPANTGGPLALGASLEDLDRACRIANSCRHVRIPTTVGFCMYVARTALDDVGNFDVAAFGHGYGEEVDFCMRATARGWWHLLACDTFVYHEGAVSFGVDAASKSDRAMDLLTARYPNYPRLIESHIRTDEVAPYRFAVTAELLRNSELTNLLMVSHALGGGVRRHISELIERVCGRANVLLLSASPSGTSLSVPKLVGHPTLELAENQISDLVTWLRAARVSRVHVHHMAGIDMNIRRLVRQLGVPFDFTVHDYFALCPQVNFLPWPNSQYCGEPGPAVCNACISDRPDSGARDILSWRRGTHLAISGCGTGDMSQRGCP